MTGSRPYIPLSFGHPLSQLWERGPGGEGHLQRFLECAPGWPTLGLYHDTESPAPEIQQKYD